MRTDLSAASRDLHTEGERKNNFCPALSSGKGRQSDKPKLRARYIAEDRASPKFLNGIVSEIGFNQAQIG